MTTPKPLIIHRHRSAASLVQRLEDTRISFQDQLDALKTSRERNRLGQFATPTALARELAAYGYDLLGTRTRIHWLDPALGTGSFYSALCSVIPASRRGRCIGYEIDPHYGNAAGALWEDAGLEVRIKDFTTAAPPAPDERASFILCNPPYVRHHHLSAAKKQHLQSVIKTRLGIAASGLSGLYCYFLWLADAWLAPGGVAGWLIPGEWMDVNYGKAIKEYLLDRVELLRIHRFDPRDVQFADALVSSAVVWFRKGKPASTEKVEISLGGTLAQPRQRIYIGRDALAASKKWSQLTLAPKPQRRQGAKPPGVRLGELFTIKRGLATGANDFFVMPAAQAKEHGIPPEFLRPILPSPRHLYLDEIRARADGTPDLDNSLFLLSAHAPELELKKRQPALWNYLQQGVKRGISERYLCRHRRPWYAQEERPPAPLLCTYMGRGSTMSKPFRFVLNWSQATAANVWLLLYPQPAFAQVIAREPARLYAVWHALRCLSAEVLISHGRVYGGGLYKLEPRELAEAPLSALDMDIPLAR